MNNIKAGFVGFGEVNSPKDILEKKCSEALKEITTMGINVHATPLVTDDAEAKDAKRAIADLKAEDFDLLIVCIAGWIPSHTVIRVTEQFSSKAMLLWGLAGYLEQGRLVTTADQAGTTALRKVFADLGYHFKFVYNTLNQKPPLAKIESFARAAGALRSISSRKIGMMGFRDMNLYNTLYEGLSLKKNFGIEINFFEMLEMVDLSRQVKEEEIETILQKVLATWEFVNEAPQDFLVSSIQSYLGLKQICETQGFHAISLKDVDGMKKLLHIPPAMIFMLLSDELDLCTIPENDAMGAVTQLIVKSLTGQCAAYLEFYEFFESSVLMGVPDFVPSEVVNGKTRVKSAAFGDISGGLLNISTMKTGRVTMSRLSNTGDHYTMHILSGEGKLRAWEEAGWDQPAPQLPSLEIFLDTPVEDFAQKVSGQHYILAYGDHADAIQDFCQLKGIQVI